MRIAFLPLVGLVFGFAAETGISAEGENWPGWRGPDGTGAARAGNPPTQFDPESNLRWKVAIDGKGKSSPIIWGDLVFVLTAKGTGKKVEKPEEEEAPEPQGGGGRGRGGRMRGIQPDEVQQFIVYALNRKDGSVAWESVANEKLPGEGTHGDGSWASGSCATDGEVLIAHFGSAGIFGYDLAGKQLWGVQLGQMKTRNAFGEGSSPAIHGDTVMIQWDHEGDSFIVALDKKTGKELWRKDRDEVTSWATPLIVEVAGKPQVIVNATHKIRAYDLSSGEIVWECGGMTTNAIPSPVYADGIVYLMSGFRGNSLLAIKLEGAKGDITGTDQIVWSFDKDTPYVPSPLLYEGALYFLKSNSGTLTCFDVAKGEPFYGPLRLEGVRNAYASPVAANGHVYFCGRDGEVEVIEHGPEFKVVSVTQFDEGFDASPAIVGDEIYLRGASHLYCFARDAGPTEDVQKKLKQMGYIKGS